MYAIRPEIVRAEGIEVFLQSVETTDDFVLIRLRSHKANAPQGDRPARVVEAERFTLRAGGGEPLPMSLLVSSGDGPLSGIIDVAFPRGVALNLEDTFTLASENCRVEFLF
jgi:hypothetical protein